MRSYGIDWMARPFVLVIAGLIVFSLYFGLRRGKVAMPVAPAAGKA